MDKSELKQLLAQLQRQLNILREREAKFGGETPLALLNQLEDHVTAVAWVERCLAGEISAETLREKLEPLLLDLDRGGTEIVAGDKSVIKIGTLVVPTVPLLALLLVVVAALAFLAFNFLGPRKMSGRFNVVVADFGQLGPNGAVERSDTGRQLSTWVFQELQTQNESYPEGNGIQIWHDSLPLTEKLASIGLISGATPAERAGTAAALAKKIGADVLIYGHMETAERPLFTLEFYVSSRLRGETDTTIGRYRLGQPLPVPANFDPNDVLAREALAAPLVTRTEALFWLILGLKEDLLGRSAQALTILRQAEAALSDWKEQGEGKETLYFFIGRSALFLNRDVEAKQALEKALAINPDYARARIALGSVTYKRAQCLLQDTAGQPGEGCANLCQGDEAGCRAACRLPPEECLALVRQGLEQTVTSYQRGLDLATGAGEAQIELIARFALATAYLLEGQTEYYLENDEAAIGFLDKAIQTTESLLSLLTEAEQYRFLGQAYLTLGNAYTLQGRIRQDQADKDDSIRLYEKARETYARCTGLQQQVPYIDQILVEQVISACQDSDRVTVEALHFIKGE